MHVREFGRLGLVSALALGGGGIGQLWGPTDRDEAVATIRAAVDGGITLIDLAPAYGDGEAERAAGQAFADGWPDHVRVTTKCRFPAIPAGQVLGTLRESLTASLARLRRQRVDVFFLHSNIVPDGDPALRREDIRHRMMPWSLYVEGALPAMAALADEGLIGAWGITGIGFPDQVLAALDADVRPAAVQAIANPLDSAGELTFFDGPPRAREIIAKAAGLGIGVMGIRAVQGGAFAAAVDRPLADDHPVMRDYRQARPFRALAADLGEDPADLAHRYALTMPGIDTVVLGVKNRRELEACLAAEAAGPLTDDTMARINAIFGR